MFIVWWVLIIIHSSLAFFLRFAIKDGKLKKRLDFELLNHHDPASRSFKLDNIKAHEAFEISSEGEWEQIRVHVYELLKSKNKVEIIFSSESLTSGMKKLAQDYSQDVRVLRLPLISFSIFSPFFLKNWLSSPKLTLVRYDFFPEIMAQKILENRRLILRWATFKNKTGLKLFLHLLCLKNFDEIYPATVTDESMLRSWLNPGKIKPAYDGRILTILSRIKERERKLKDKFPFYQNWKELLGTYNFKFILGSAYMDEVDFLLQPKLQNLIKSKKIFVCIVPHKIDPEWLNFLTKNKVSFYRIYPEISEEEFAQQVKSFKSDGGVWLIDLKGVLCELYLDFPWAYVGGGFHRWVHSTLEPFLAGAQVLSGPKVQRSTEVDLCLEQDKNRFHLFSSQSQVSDFISEKVERV